MKFILFFMGFIWPLAAIASIVIGSSLGLDRARLKRELVDFWNIESQTTLTLFIRRAALVLSWFGFLFPLIFPLSGFAAGFLSIVLFSLISLM